MNEGRGLRVLQVAHGFPPLEHAGAELAAFWMCQGLQRRGHRVEAFVHTSRPDQEPYTLREEEVEGLPVFRLRTPVERFPSLRASYEDPRVRSFFEQHLERGFDLVHVHHLFGTSTDLIEACAARGIPCVVTLHDFWYQCPRGQRFTPRDHLCEQIQPLRCSACIAKKRLRWAYNAATAEMAGKGLGLLARPLDTLARTGRYVRDNAFLRPIHRRREFILSQLNQASLVHSPSRFLLEEYRRHGLEGPRLEYSPYIVDREWAAALQPKDAPSSPLRFGFVGSFLRSKGVDLLARAFEQIEEGRAELHLHGTSSYDGGRFFEALRRRHRRADVHFHGPFARDRLPEVLRPLDVLIVPSRWYENAPVTLDEAALARIPVIASDHGGMKELVENRGNGLLFRRDDPADLARGMRRFLDEPELWARLREPKGGLCEAEDQLDEVESWYRDLTA